MRTPAEYVAHFKDKSYMEPIGWEYLRFHLRRYAYLLDTAGRLLAGLERPRILDVGMSFQTELIRERFPAAILDTMGFGDARFVSAISGRHWQIDLNNAGTPETCLDPEEHDVAVMAEVIEHLYTPPHLVLGMLEAFVRPGGYLIVQTPNAIALGKRLGMLRGVSPFEMIREGIGNPGHFCEYTIADLRDVVSRTGFAMESAELTNYFGPGGWRNNLYDAICRLLPGDMHDGITVVLRRR